ncbi:Dehydrodolichyl diphosphate synthase 2 [Sesamum angolense]|uniref:Alkyl transferase n=1 Tax=Sesamum angolense TaxID=2727404 RepID=A0AAE1WNR1_9LAMI|nr:Dehydrodolichyl diphosphate synthase 2 [Sesamum angolense]
MSEESATIGKGLPEVLSAQLMPKHVAFIADGNRRWANERGLPAELGHCAGKRALVELTFLSRKWGIKVVSIFAFSTENWKRPKEDVSSMMCLFQELQDFDRYGTRISCIGDRSRLPECLREVINSLEEKTKCNNGLHLIFAINYSGRFDILQATRRIAGKVRDGKLVGHEDEIDENVMDEELQTNCAEFPCPDLVIRTSGEQRLSNFMLWQLAYSELFFSHKNFPDFKEQDYVEALVWFQRRNRRFGGP